jgi:UDP-3-O-[3-hydroxymyristoyl] N-acetylglucosamine deacetylase
LLANEDAWELVTFEDPKEAPISYMQPVAAG